MWRRHTGLFLRGSRCNVLLRIHAPRHCARAISSNGWSATTWPWTFGAILVTAATKFGASQGRSADDRPLRQQRTGLKALAVGQCRRSSKCAAYSVEQDTISLACAQYCGGHGPGFTPRIRAVRDVLARTLDRRYDSVLINYYEDGRSGMNYHADPDQGDKWGHSTCVVSAGDARLFVFRRIGAPAQRCTFALRSGDVVEMFGSCQADYQHSIRTEAEAMRVGPRLSLVYKRTMATETCAASHERPGGRLHAALRTMSPRLGVGRARVTLNGWT